MKLKLRDVWNFRLNENRQRLRLWNVFWQGIPESNYKYSQREIQIEYRKRGSDDQSPGCRTKIMNGMMNLK